MTNASQPHLGAQDWTHARLVPSRLTKKKKKSASTAVNINIPSSSLSDSALKCHLFHHVAALFLKTVRAAACLGVKLAATHFSPQQASNGPGVLGHDNCL